MQMIGKKLIDEVRRRFSGETTISFNSQSFLVNPVKWANSLDVIGLDCYFSLNVPNTTNLLPWQVPTIQQLVQAWDPYIKQLQTLSQNLGKNIICTNIGYQSKPYSWITPRTVQQLDEGDCSVWSQCFNMDSQINTYTAFFNAIWNQSWFNGAYFWIWSSDPLAGGTTDETFTPWNKPSLGILKQWWLS